MTPRTVPDVVDVVVLISPMEKWKNSLVSFRRGGPLVIGGRQSADNVLRVDLLKSTWERVESLCIALISR